MSGLRVAEPVAYRGVQVTEVVEVGEGPSDEMRPSDFAITAEHGNIAYGGSPDVLPGKFFNFVFADSNQVKHETNSLVITGGHSFVDESPLFYFGAGGDSDNNAFDDATKAAILADGEDIQAFMVFCIRISDTEIALARTKADAQNNVRMGFKNVASGTDGATLVDLKYLTKTKNSCFDFNGNVPAFQTYNGLLSAGTYPSLSNYNPAYNSGYPESGSLTWWRHWGNIVLSNSGWTSYTGMNMLENEPPYDPVPRGSEQRKILVMYGSGSNDPGDVGNLFGVNNSRAGNLLGDVGSIHCHTTDLTKAVDYDSVQLAGSGTSWTKHEWYQPLVTEGQFRDHTTTPEGDTNPIWNDFAYVTSTGKIKFSAKIRIPANDQLRAKNFGGMYVRAEYDSALYGSGIQRIWYIKIQNRADTIDLPTGSLTGHAGKNNWPGHHGTNLQSFSGAGSGQPKCRPDNKIVTELGTYYADEFGSFKEISEEFSIGDLATTTSGKSKVQLSFHVYFSECGANMSGTSASGTNDENGNPVAPATTQDINPQHVTADQLIPGQKYVIADYGTLSYTDMYALAGVDPTHAEEENASAAVGERTVTVITTGGEDWSRFEKDNYNGSKSAIPSNPGVGYMFKVANIAGITPTPSNFSGTIRRGGYPIGSTFIPTTTGAATGQFIPVSGAIHFYSPTCEYIPG